MTHTTVSQTFVGIAPAGISQALAVAHELHCPEPRTPEARTPEVAPQLMGLRTPATRPHRRKIPLRRLSALCV
ncbi:hypothetical protein C4B68_21735 [Streptomyces dengpaensis]|uniref:Uncharacterized protein n=2 Tax=Streptomyces TaxID=1883 RepID=A0ABM6T2J5_9ACTN|nr:hypothetical protein C4B68_21735 [Streptomyces dengpaensis]